MFRFALIAVCLSSAAPVVASEFHFQSPSGNIRCVMSSAGIASARCDLGIAIQSFTDRPPACDGDWGRSFKLGPTGPGDLNCQTDPIGGPAEPLTLPYGASAVNTAITCRSEPVGMTCTNSDGGGFALRRAEQRIF